MLQRVKELCRYLPGLEGETRSRYCVQVVICAALVLFRSAFLYVSAVQPSLFQGQSLCSKHLKFAVFLYHLISLYVHVFFEGVGAMTSGPWILVEDLSSVYSDVEVDRTTLKHAHKKRKLADGREKTMVRTDLRFS